MSAWSELLKSILLLSLSVGRMPVDFPLEDMAFQWTVG